MKVPFMVDSGAYSAFRKGLEIDIDEYIKFLKEKIVMHTEVVYINLDVIGDGEASYKNWIYMRKKGLNPIPVFHVGSDDSLLQKYLEKTDHIGIGALANLTARRRLPFLDRIWTKYLLDEKLMPKYKVHGLGVTSFGLMARYPWHSLDSTSWFRAGIYGKLMMPQYIKGEWRFDLKPKLIGITHGHRIKEAGKHFDTISPEEQKVVSLYLKSMKVKMGKSKFRKVEGKDKEIVIEGGISNDHRIRCFLNAIFFSKFMALLPYPRPMVGRVPKGFF